jgi:hypothetical protein
MSSFPEKVGIKGTVPQGRSARNSRRRRETVYVGRRDMFDDNSLDSRRRIETLMGTVRSKQLTIRTRIVLSVVTMLLSTGLAYAQTCLTAGDMDEPTRAALVNTAKRYFDMATRGDSAAMRQNSIASVASDFSGIETAVKDNQANFSGVQATPRPPFLLKAEGTAPFERAEFLCGVFGKSGQTTDSAVFVIPNLPPGNYAVAILDVPAKQPDTVSFVLQQAGKDWKIGGFYVKETQIAGHDSAWFADHARAFKSKGQNRNAWLYFIEARDLAVPLPFMYTQLTDKLADESETVKPSDLPTGGSTVELAAGGKTQRLTALFPLAVGQDLDLVVKYQCADVSNSAQTFKDNTAVISALVGKFPEFRDAFDGVVARAVEPTTGHDYGSLLPMKDIK